MMAGIAGLAIPAILLWAGVAYLTAPHPAHVGDAPADLAARSMSIPYGDGQTLAAWYVSGKRDAGAVLLLHGIRANRESQIARMRLLAAEGYSVLAIDLPSHGESTGQRITFGHGESRAVIAAVQFLRQQNPGARIGIIGQSLGGASAALAGAALDADAVVLEAVFGDIETAAANRLHNYFGIAGSLAAPLLVQAASWHLGLPPGALTPARAIADVKAAVMVIAGEADTRATPEEGRRIYEAARDPKEYWLVPGAAHVDFLKADSAAYRARVLPFLRQHLTETTR